MLDPKLDPDNVVSDLTTRLYGSLSLKNGGSKYIENTVTNSSHQIRCWKFNEWDYYKNEVPCQARGLFTIDDKIVVRGYNKFFNVGEVSNTKIEVLERDTTGPYSLTVKENGCIIFVSGLSDGTIIVCSKHSSGDRSALTRNHAMEGESQLYKHLESIGRSSEQLAKTLAAHNVSLVFELCDDTFEEHILSYQEKAAGLYLHGINYNLVEFSTYPMEEVSKFAEEWQFKYVESFTMETFGALMDFLTECEKTGTWKGREIEGFVIRCDQLDHENHSSKNFFFKYKFEQPYLLYRDFREVTKQLINTRATNEILRKFTDHKYIVAKYIEFVQVYFTQHPHKKELYLQGHGIIELRKLFLNSLGLSEINGINLININEDLKAADQSGEPIRKFVLVPIATIGCGKTTIGNTLINLFDWSLIQNDNIGTKAKNQLVLRCLEELVNHDLVICDRNNHQRRERKQLFDQFDQFKLNYLPTNTALVFVALNFIPRGVDYQELSKVTSDRIIKRGNNHQSIKNDTDPELTKKVMAGFIQRFQPLSPNYEPDNEFDLIIDLNFKDSSFESTSKILQVLKHAYPELISEIPTETTINSAIQTALEYKPTFTKTFGSAPKRRVDYFGVKISRDQVVSILDMACVNNQYWVKMNLENRIQKEFHVTLAHSSSSRREQDKWKAWHELLGTTKKPTSDRQISNIMADIELNHVILSEKLICIKVTLVKTYSDTEIEVHPLNKVLHITIGTFGDTKSYMSNQTLEELQSHQYTDEEFNGILKDGTTVQIIPLSSPILSYQPICAYYS